jgi:hypothetical protein
LVHSACAARRAQSQVTNWENLSRNKGLHAFRHTSIRLEKERLQQFRALCAKIGISTSTGLRWLIDKAIIEGEVTPPRDRLSDPQKPE